MKGGEGKKKKKKKKAAKVTGWNSKTDYFSLFGLHAYILLRNSRDLTAKKLHKHQYCRITLQNNFRRFPGLQMTTSSILKHFKIQMRLLYMYSQTLEKRLALLLHPYKMHTIRGVSSWAGSKLTPNCTIWCRILAVYLEKRVGVGGGSFFIHFSGLG